MATQTTRPKKRKRHGDKTAHERYTTAQVAQAITVAGGLLAGAAQQLGCERRTVYSYVERHPELAEVIRQCRESTKDLAEHKLYQAIQNGELVAIFFYLKCQAKERGYIERTDARVEHVADLKTLATQLEALSDADLAALDRIAAHLRAT